MPYGKEYLLKSPFIASEHVGVITCKHVLENNADICYAGHDEEDSGWQFLCNADKHIES